jgi:hypothetical protein
MWMQKQYLVDNCEYTVNFKLNDPTVVLHAKDESIKYKIKIEQFTLHLRQVNVSPSVLMGHAKGFQSHNAVYPYNGHKIFTHLIKPGGRQEALSDFFNGVYPKCIIMGLVEHDAYMGKFTKNPYNFKHFDVNEVSLTVNGQPFPAMPYKPDFEGKRVVREYYALFSQMGKPGIFGDDVGLRLVDFMGGNALYVWNLAGDLCLSGHAQPARLSNIGLTVSFAKAVPVTIELIAMAIYDTKLEQAGNRLWFLDPTQSAN